VRVRLRFTRPGARRKRTATLRVQVRGPRRLRQARTVRLVA
jgi:hypothetical protein